MDGLKDDLKKAMDRLKADLIGGNKAIQVEANEGLMAEMKAMRAQM